MNPLPLIGIIIGILIFRPLKGEGILIMGLHEGYLREWTFQSLGDPSPELLGGDHAHRTTGFRGLGMRGWGLGVRD